MTEETLKKAQALKREIEDTKRLLGELSVRRMYADKNLAVEKKRKPWIMRALNLSEKMNEPKKSDYHYF